MAQPTGLRRRFTRLGIVIVVCSALIAVGGFTLGGGGVLGILGIVGVLLGLYLATTAYFGIGPGSKLPD